MTSWPLRSRVCIASTLLLEIAQAARLPTFPTSHIRASSARPLGALNRSPWSRGTFSMRTTMAFCFPRASDRRALARSCIRGVFVLASWTISTHRRSQQISLGTSWRAQQSVDFYRRGLQGLPRTAARRGVQQNISYSDSFPCTMNVVNNR
jgi:hypothetical protein